MRWHVWCHSVPTEGLDTLGPTAVLWPHIDPTGTAVIIAKRTDPRFHLRLPKKVLKAIDQAAGKNGRSRNTEILFRLSESLRFSPNQGEKVTQSSAGEQ